MVQCNVGTILGICICLYLCVYVGYTETANYILSPLKALLPDAATRGSYNLRLVGKHYPKLNKDLCVTNLKPNSGGGGNSQDGDRRDWLMEWNNKTLLGEHLQYLYLFHLF